MFIDLIKLFCLTCFPPCLSVCLQTCVLSFISSSVFAAADQVALGRAGWLWSDGCGGEPTYHHHLGAERWGEGQWETAVVTLIVTGYLQRNERNFCLRPLTHQHPKHAHQPHSYSALDKYRQYFVTPLGICIWTSVLQLKEVIGDFWFNIATLNSHASAYYTDAYGNLVHLFQMSRDVTECWYLMTW